MAPLFDITRVRADFPMLKKTMHGKPLIYLDTAATSQKPQSVIDAVHRFYSAECGTVHRGVYELVAHSTHMHSAVRKKVQQFIKARSQEEIVFTKGTTDSINLVAHAYGKAFLKQGDEIIISEMEHHSNIVPWQLLAEERELKLHFIPMNPEGELKLDVFKTLLNKKTKLVSIAHIANATGTINPIEEIISLSHEVGAKVLVDGAQAASHLPLDVEALDVDFYAFSGHKIYGPTGVGILYGKKEILQEMPPHIGGGDMIESVTLEGSTFQDPPLRFEAGTPPIAQIMGLGAAIDYIESFGREEIQKWLDFLLVEATKKLLKIPGLTIIGAANKKGPIISFTLDGVHPLDLGTLLGLKGVAIRTGHLCAQPALARFGLTSAARISLGIYNTPDDIDIAVEGIEEELVLLKKSDQ